MYRLLVIAISLVIACADDAPKCGAPDHVGYDCDPTTGPGCVGGPVWQGAIDHPGTVYPAECTATLPECRTLGNGPVTAQCQNVGSAGFLWVEPQ